MEGFAVLAICGAAALLTAKFAARAEPFDWLVDKVILPWICF